MQILDLPRVRLAAPTPRHLRHLQRYRQNHQEQPRRAPRGHRGGFGRVQIARAFHRKDADAAHRAVIEAGLRACSDRPCPPRQPRRAPRGHRGGCRPALLGLRSPWPSARGRLPPRCGGASYPLHPSSFIVREGKASPYTRTRGEPQKLVVDRPARDLTRAEYVTSVTNRGRRPATRTDGRPRVAPIDPIVSTTEPSPAPTVATWVRCGAPLRCTATAVCNHRGGAGRRPDSFTARLPYVRVASVLHARTQGRALAFPRCQAGALTWGRSRRSVCGRSPATLRDCGCGTPQRPHGCVGRFRIVLATSWPRLLQRPGAAAAPAVPHTRLNSRPQERR